MLGGGLDAFSFRADVSPLFIETVTFELISAFVFKQLFSPHPSSQAFEDVHTRNELQHVPYVLRNIVQEMYFAVGSPVIT